MANFGLFPVTGETVTTTSTSNLVTLSPSRSGVLSIADTAVRVVTQIDNDATAAVLQLLKDSTELGTITLSDSLAKGEQKFFTPTSTYLANPYVTFTSSNDLKIKVKTAGTDGSAAAGAVEGLFAISQPEA